MQHAWWGSGDKSLGSRLCMWWFHYSLRRSSNFPRKKFGLRRRLASLVSHFISVKKYKARFPLRRLFFARSDFRLLKLNRFQISSSRELHKTKEKVASREKSRLVENGLKAIIKNLLYLLKSNPVPNPNRKIIRMYSFCKSNLNSMKSNDIMPEILLGKFLENGLCFQLTWGLSCQDSAVLTLRVIFYSYGL